MENEIKKRRREEVPGERGGSAKKTRRSTSPLSRDVRVKKEPRVKTESTFVIKREEGSKDEYDILSAVKRIKLKRKAKALGITVDELIAQNAAKKAAKAGNSNRKRRWDNVTPASTSSSSSSAALTTDSKVLLFNIYIHLFKQFIL